MEVEIMSCVHSNFVIYAYVYMSFCKCMLLIYLSNFMYWKSHRRINSSYEYLAWILRELLNGQIKKANNNNKTLTLRIVTIIKCRNIDHGPFETHYELIVQYRLLWIRCMRLLLY